MTVGTTVREGVDYAGFDWRQRVALVLGNEASGLGEELLGRLDQRVSIPMVGRAESLNVAVSASVLCFEALRQRRTPAIPAPPLPSRAWMHRCRSQGSSRTRGGQRPTDRGGDPGGRQG